MRPMGYHHMEKMAVLPVLLLATGMQVSSAGISRQEAQQDQHLQQTVKMFSLQRGVNIAATNNVFVRYNFTLKGLSLTSFSVCYWIRFERLTPLVPHVSYATSNEDANTLLFYHDEDKLSTFVYSTSQRQTWTQTFQLYPEVWNHLCHLVDGHVYTVYWQGKLFVRGPVEGQPGVPLNGSLVLGQEQDSLGGGFDKYQVLHGDIAQVNIWDSHLAEADVKEMATCRLLGLGNIFSSDTFDVEVVGAVQQSSVDLGFLCRTTPHYVILPEERTFDATRTLCRLLNASMTVFSSSSENQNFLEEFVPFADVCSPGTTWKLWLGITDAQEDGVWVDVQTKEPIAYTNFKIPYPIGGSHLECVLMLTDGSWADVRCKASKCGVCSLDRFSFLKLRGFCFDMKSRTNFRLGGYLGGRPVFRGLHQLVIHWDAASLHWSLVNIDEETLLARSTLPDVQSYPLGQNEWVAVEPVCGVPKGSAFNLSLSSCPEAQFICKSGDCIDHSYRCNLRYDCIDGSDEDDCNIVFVGSGYRQHLPPRGANDSTLRLTPEITITRITEVDDLHMAISLEFFVSLTWRDERLSFRHLDPERETSIPASDAAQMWIPDYHLLNLEAGQAKELEKTVTVTTANNATSPHFNSINRDIVYPGVYNNITSSTQFTARLTCSFDLYIYPFDIQECSIDIGLPKNYDGSVEFSDAERSGSYTGPYNLALYTVKDVAFGPNSGEARLVLKFALHRRQGVILLSTFVPSVLLLLVSWATLFVRLDVPTVRAPMALTTLLVLYTLFSNLSGSMPNTAAIKMIDIWFFYIIFLLFLNIMIHIFVEPFFEALARSAKVEAKGAMYDQRESPQSKSERVIAVYRNYVFPVAFCCFNVLFWLMVFLKP